MNELFFELIRVSIGTQDRLSRIPSEAEWEELYDMAEKQSLVGVCFYGLKRMGADADDGFERIGMSETMYMEWMYMALNIQQNYDNHTKLIAKLAKVYESEGIGMMLLKGHGLSLHYPMPELRNPGDVDVYLFNTDGAEEPAWERGDEAIERTLKVEIRNDSEHHTQFKVDDILIENHYDFVNTRIRRSSKSLEKTFKVLAEDHSNIIEIGGQKVCLPSDKLNALFLLRHNAGHFAAEGIHLRNVLDWGLFVCRAKKIDWEWLWQMAEDYNMHRFLMSINAICIEVLGMDAKKFVQKHYDQGVKERVLNEIVHGIDLVPNASPWLRTKRWWQHRWKHRICYSDSMLSSFIYSVKANLEVRG